MQNRDEVWIFTALEVKLCMHILGKEDWDVFPVQKTGRSLKERLLESFLHLAEMGFLEKDGDGYREAQKMGQLFLPFCEGKFVVQALRKNQCPMVFAEDTDGVMVMELMSEQENAIRLYRLGRQETEKLFASFVSEQCVQNHFMELPEKERVMQMDTVLRIHNGEKCRTCCLWRDKDGMKMLHKEEEQMLEFTCEDMWKWLEGADNDHSEC